MNILKKHERRLIIILYVAVISTAGHHCLTLSEQNHILLNMESQF